MPAIIVQLYCLPAMRQLSGSLNAVPDIKTSRSGAPRRIMHAGQNHTAFVFDNVEYIGIKVRVLGSNSYSDCLIYSDSIVTFNSLELDLFNSFSMHSNGT